MELIPGARDCYLTGRQGLGRCDEFKDGEMGGLSWIIQVGLI